MNNEINRELEISMVDKNSSAISSIEMDLRSWGLTGLANAVDRKELSCQTACRKAIKYFDTSPAAQAFFKEKFDRCEEMDI